VYTQNKGGRRKSWRGRQGEEPLCIQGCQVSKLFRGEAQEGGSFLEDNGEEGGLIGLRGEGGLKGAIGFQEEALEGCMLQGGGGFFREGVADVSRIREIAPQLGEGFEGFQGAAEAMEDEACGEGGILGEQLQQGTISALAVDDEGASMFFGQQNLCREPFYLFFHGDCFCQSFVQAALSDSAGEGQQSFQILHEGVFLVRLEARQGGGVEAQGDVALGVLLGPTGEGGPLFWGDGGEQKFAHTNPMCTLQEGGTRLLKELGVQVAVRVKQAHEVCRGGWRLFAFVVFDAIKTAWLHRSDSRQVIHGEGALVHHTWEGEQGGRRPLFVYE